MFSRYAEVAFSYASKNEKLDLMYNDLQYLGSLIDNVRIWPCSSAVFIKLSVSKSMRAEGGYTRKGCSKREYWYIVIGMFQSQTED